MAHVEFDLVRLRIAAAAGRAFQAVCAAHPDERFYAFVLTTYDDGCYVNPSFNSEEGYARLAAENGGDPAALGEQRWNPFEWPYEHAEGDEFDEVNALLGADGEGFYDEEDTLDFAKYRAGIMAAMVLGLRDADAADAFGTGAARASITLFCTIADSAEAEWFALDSAKRLNSPAAFDVFSRQWTETMGEVDEDEVDDELRSLYLARFAPAP
jgi:hypothetical protein